MNAFKTGEVRPQILAGLQFREFLFHNLLFYHGREDMGDPEVPLCERAVLPLTEDLRSNGRNVGCVTCDSFFTSLCLGQKLMQRNRTLVGTILANRREFPA